MHDFITEETRDMNAGKVKQLSSNSSYSMHACKTINNNLKQFISEIKNYRERNKQKDKPSCTSKNKY